MKKALLLSILSLFLCTNYAFATSEATEGPLFQGNIATLKYGYLPATVRIQILGEPFADTTGYLMIGVLTIKAEKDGRTVYNSTLEYTGYFDESSFILTTKGTAILSGKLSSDGINWLMVLQIPAEGITGKFTDDIVQ